jgi:hypothetical protein
MSDMSLSPTKHHRVLDCTFYGADRIRNRVDGTSHLLYRPGCDISARWARVAPRERDLGGVPKGPVPLLEVEPQLS